MTNTGLLWQYGWLKPKGPWDQLYSCSLRIQLLEIWTELRKCNLAYLNEPASQYERKTPNVGS